MLKHTKKIKEIYEDIQRELYYMIPEKWDELYLYASVIDKQDGTQKGELYFYYIPKGILRKKPVSVYEVPAKFNLDETQYLGLVDLLYNSIKALREEYRKSEPGLLWSNLTLRIKNLKFNVEFDYEDLEKSNFTSFERHVIWRHTVLGITMEQCSREEKEILKRYYTGARIIGRKEIYDTGIYIKNIKNIVDFTTESYADTKDIDYIKEEEEVSKKNKNQILMNEENETKSKDNKYTFGD